MDEDNFSTKKCNNYGGLKKVRKNDKKRRITDTWTLKEIKDYLKKENFKIRGNKEQLCEFIDSHINGTVKEPVENDIPYIDTIIIEQKSDSGTVDL